MPTYPLPTLACTITPAGITAPALEDIINSLIFSFQSIFGSDVQLTPDTQDYQDISIRAQAISDSNNATIAAWNQMNPQYSQGVGQDTTYLLNGIQREASTNSTVAVLIVGVAGTEIIFGVIQDEAGNLWNLPPSVEIPDAGEITVTATAQQPGSITAAENTVNIIYTQVLNWQSVNNPSSAALPGDPVETDGEFRQRQQQSTALNSITPLQAIAAALANLAGVERSIVYENPTGAYGTGLETPPLVPTQPPHSICAVVGGTASNASIAQTIEATKSPGTSTSEGMAGITTVLVYDPSGVPININFFELTEQSIYVSLSITPLTGWVASTEAVIVAAIVDFINGLGIGDDVYYNWLFGPASLYGSGLEFTFKITALTVGIVSSPTGVIDIPIAFNQAANTTAGSVILTVA